MKGYEEKKEQNKEMGLCTYKYKKERQENLKRKVEAKRGKRKRDGDQQMEV